MDLVTCGFVIFISATKSVMHCVQTALSSQGSKVESPLLECNANAAAILQVKLMRAIYLQKSLLAAALLQNTPAFHSSADKTDDDDHDGVI